MVVGIQGNCTNPLVRVVIQKSHIQDVIIANSMIWSSLLRFDFQPQFNSSLPILSTTRLRFFFSNEYNVGNADLKVPLPLQSSRKRECFCYHWLVFSSCSPVAYLSSLILPWCYQFFSIHHISTFLQYSQPICILDYEFLEWYDSTWNWVHFYVSATILW